MGDVIRFPSERVKPVEEEPEEESISCMDCQNVYVGTKGLFCGVFKEVIIFDDIAKDCSEFEPF